jgi:hypothetical protein
MMRSPGINSLTVDQLLFGVEFRQGWRRGDYWSYLRQIRGQAAGGGLEDVEGQTGRSRDGNMDDMSLLEPKEGMDGRW